MPAELSPLEIPQPVIFRLRGTDDGSQELFTIHNTDEDASLAGVEWVAP